MQLGAGDILMQALKKGYFLPNGTWLEFMRIYVRGGGALVIVHIYQHPRGFMSKRTRTWWVEGVQPTKEALDALRGYPFNG